MAPLGDEIMSAELDYYAANFSGEELRQILAFLNSPAGQAEAAKLPMLSAPIGKLLMGSPADIEKAVVTSRAEFAQAPPATRQSIDRIMAAANVEGQARMANAMYSNMLAGALSKMQTTTGRTAPAADTASQNAAGDAYARNGLGIEQGFYATNFSGEQLAVIAAYLESEGGRVAIEKKPLLRRAAGQVLRARFAVILPNLERDVCAAVGCTAEQRAGVVALLDRLKGALPAMGA
jgi:hypothetical protein